MISKSEIVDAIGPLNAAALQHWFEQGWVMARRDDGSGSLQFDPSDVARIHLICELHYELQIEEDTMPVVLSLLDQLYGARHSLASLIAAVEAQPHEVRATIVDHRQSSGCRRKSTSATVYLRYVFLRGAAVRAPEKQHRRPSVQIYRFKTSRRGH